jgi:hypothetical protein
MVSLLAGVFASAGSSSRNLLMALLTSGSTAGLIRQEFIFKVHKNEIDLSQKFSSIRIRIHNST